MAISKQDEMNDALRRVAGERITNQNNTVYTIKTGMVQKGRKPKYNNADPKCTVTFTMTASRKEKLRRYAFEQRKTISDIIGEFVDSL